MIAVLARRSSPTGASDIYTHAPNESVRSVRRHLPPMGDERREKREWNGCAVPYGCRYWVGIISIKMDLVKGIRFAYGRGKSSLSSSTRWHMPGMLSPWKDVTGDKRAPVPQNSTLLK